MNIIKWLTDLIDYILEFEQQSILQKYALIPVRTKKLKTINEELYWDGGISKELKNIHDLLKTIPYDEILLHEGLECLGEKLWPYDKTKSDNEISKLIDQEFKNVDSIKITPNFIEALQKLFSWTENMPDEELKELFALFSINKAKLMLATLGTEIERNMAFNILKSDKKEVLARLAISSITSKELEVILGNENEFKLFLKWKGSTVNDKNASEELGDIGEKYLNNLLINRFKDANEVEVEWVAKTRGESNFDFEIRKNNIPWIYIDAKTTNKGIANSDTVPFFMRRGQWEFLPTLNKEQIYFIARIFINEANSMSVKFLKIKSEEL